MPKAIMADFIIPPPPSPRHPTRPAYAVPAPLPPPQPTDYEQRTISSSFDVALLDFERQTGCQVKYPSFSNWLKTLYSHSQREKASGSGWWYILYPTRGQYRLAVDDEPSDADNVGPFPPKSGIIDGNDRTTLRKISPFEIWHDKLFSRIREEIVWQTTLRYDDGGFLVGTGTKNKSKLIGSEGSHAKIYGCLKTSEAPRFARRLATWSARKAGSVDFAGKFYELYSKNSHNKLCIYVPFQDFPEVAAFLATEALDDFHPVEFNYPAGAHLAPGLSATIITGSGHFDELIKDELTEVPKSNEEEFIRAATERLTGRRSIRYHFRWLKEKNGSDLLK